MTVIADASTLIGLSRIEQLSLLAELYGQVTVPRAVYNEIVGEPKTGFKQVKEAKYLKVENVSDEVAVDLLLGSFGRGEAEVLVLAREKGADIVLIDERKARKAARRAGFRVVGILGILLIAKKKGLVPFIKPLVEELVSQGFRLGMRVIAEVLREARELE